MQDTFLPVIIKRIDDFLSGMGSRGDNSCIATGEFFLDQHDSRMFFQSLCDESPELCSRRLTSFFLNGELFQMIFTGEISEGRMINQKGPASAFFEYRTDLPVCGMDSGYKPVQIPLEVDFVLRIFPGQGFVDISGQDNMAVLKK